MALLLLLRHILFVGFFVWSGIWRVALIPLLIGVGLMLYASPKKNDEGNTSLSMNEFFQEHVVTLSWIMIMIGLRGFLDVVAGGSSLMIGAGLVLLNLILRIGSYIFKYEDGTQVFHYGWYLSSILLFVSLGRMAPYQILLDCMIGWLSVTMAVYAFLIFVLGSVGLVKDRSLHYPLFITFNCCILYLVYYYTQQTLGLSLVVAQGYLLVLYALIWRVMDGTEATGYTTNEGDDLFKHILSGQTITRFKKRVVAGPVELIYDIQNFLEAIPSKSKSILGLFNVILVFGQTALFVFRMRDGAMGIDQLRFWLGVGFFFVSFLLLRSIGYAYKFQRIVAFVIINVALYLSIIALFGNNVVYIVGIGIIWTIVNSLLIFHRGFFDQKNILNDDDILYRIGGTVVTTCCNLYFMMLLPLSLQLVFSLICLYIGIQVFLIRYNLASIGKI